MLLTLRDVDQLLDNTAVLDASTPAPRLRGGRDDLVHVAVLLSYARHVLSVDLGALEAITEASARQAIEGAADGLMPAPAEVARLDPRSPDAVQETLREIEVQVSLVSERRELVEKRGREVQAFLVEQYKRGVADPDDWLR